MIPYVKLHIIGEGRDMCVHVWVQGKPIRDGKKKIIPITCRKCGADGGEFVLEDSHWSYERG